MTRRICAVTGTRAEYGLLYWTLHEINKDPALDLQLVVTGSHLSDKFGETRQQIINDGFGITAEVNMALEDDSTLAIAHAMGQATSGLADALQMIRPDLLLILGDRYEILAAAQAAMLLRIPIAHIHGGESTEGLIDEAIRHAVTKMSHIHCVAAEPYAQRVIQMGEQPDTVHVVGACGFDQLARCKLLNRSDLEKSLDFQLGPQNFLITLHPETLSSRSAELQVSPLLAALSAFPEAHIVITGSNADPAGRQISELLQKYAASRGNKVCYHESLGQQRYLSLLQKIDVVIGNSSSGIIEAPAVGKSVVNIGKRQCNRLRAPAIIDCPSQSDAIRDAIKQALSPTHQVLAACRETPYGSAGAAERIKRVLRDTPLEGILQKRFYDLPIGLSK